MENESGGLNSRRGSFLGGARPTVGLAVGGYHEGGDLWHVTVGGKISWEGPGALGCRKFPPGGCFFFKLLNSNKLFLSANKEVVLCSNREQPKTKTHSSTSIPLQIVPHDFKIMDSL